MAALSFFHLTIEHEESNKEIEKLMKTYRSDSNIELHQNLGGSDQKNIHFVADQSTLTVDPDHLRVCPEIDLTFVTASRTLNH
jgi:hypothetical protein